MKKHFFILFSLLSIFLTSCRESDKEYIERIKKVTDKNGETLEQIIDNYLISAEFLHMNRDADLDEYLTSLSNEIEVAKIEEKYGDKEAMIKMTQILKQRGINYPEIENITWKILFKSNITKVIEVSSDNIILKFPVYETSNNTIFNLASVEVYTHYYHKLNSRQLDVAYEIVHFIGIQSL